MPVWMIIDVRTAQAEIIVADRVEEDGAGWSWWSVVMIINSPRWSCVRRVAAADLVCRPLDMEPKCAEGR